MRAVQGEDQAAIAGPLEADFPAVVGLLDRPGVDRRFEAAVAERGGVLVLKRVAGGRRQRRREDDVHRLGAVVRERGIRAVAEQPEVETRFQLLGAFRSQHVRRLLAAGQQPADPVLRGGNAGPLRDAAKDLGEKGPRCDVRRGLGPRFAVGDAELPEREPRPLAQHLRERPGGARFGEPRAPGEAAEVREAVVTQRGCQIHLVVQVDGRLAEVGLAVNDDLVIEREVALDGIGELVRRGRHQPAPDRKEVPGVLAAQVLAERQRPANPGVDRIRRRAGEVVVDLVVHDLPLDHPAEVAYVG